MRPLLIVDPEKCNGCHGCEIACSVWREGESNPEKSRIRMMPFLTPGQAFFYPNVCQQCEVPYCALACPTGALWKNASTGVVDLTQDKCIGCRMCLVACPIGAIAISESGRAVKCDLCGGDPMCVRFCRPEAITLGIPNELSEAKRQSQAARVRRGYQAVPATAQ